MSTLPQVTYTDRTQESVLRSLNKLLRTRFPEDFKDAAKAGIAQACITALSYMHGQRSFYYNRLAINSLLSTCDTREAAREICKQLSYTLRPATSASVAVRAYVQPMQTVPVTLRQGTLVTVGDLVFEVPQDTVIPASKAVWPDETTDAIIALSEGKTQEDTFVGTGEPWQQYLLTRTNVVHGSLRVTVGGVEWGIVQSVIFAEGSGYGRDGFTGDGADGQTYTLSLLNAIIDPEDADAPILLVNGEPWLQVDIFTGAEKEFILTQDVDGVTTLAFGLGADGSAPGTGQRIDLLYHITGSQRRLQVGYDDDDRGVLTFGDSQTGLIPPTGASIVATYRIGGGTRGNVSIGAIDTTARGFLPDGKEISVRLYNYEPGSGGEPRETLDHAKYYAPDYAKSNERAVTVADHNALGSTYRDPFYGAPAYTSAKLKQSKPEKNEVQIAVWSRDEDGHLAAAGTALKKALLAYMNSKRIACVYYSMVDGTVIYFDIAIDVSLKSGYYADTVFANIQTTLQSYFDSALVKPGDDLSLSQLYSVIQKVDGVYRAVITQVTGTIKILNTYTGDGSSAVVSGRLVKPDGLDIVAGSVRIDEPSQTTPSQSAADDGEGGFTGDINPLATNQIQYDTGVFSVELASAPATNVPIFVTARYVANLDWIENLETSGSIASVDLVSEYNPIVKRPPRGMVTGQTVAFNIPSDLMPIVPGRCFFLGGYGLAPLVAFDDGEGNIFGDVDPAYTNVIDYEAGTVSFKWNAPPVSTGLVCPMTISPAPDGTTKVFTFQPTNPALWFPTIAPASEYKGQIRLDFSTAWAASGFRDVFDNWQEHLDGLDAEHYSESYIRYANGYGQIEFKSAPQAGEPTTVNAVVSPVTQFLYSAFVWYVKTLGGPGHDFFLYADNEGRVWGTPANAYPTDRLDHTTGHIVSGLTGGPVPAGRTPVISYDSWLQANERDLPVDDLQIGGLGRMIATELEKEINL